MITESPNRKNAILIERFKKELERIGISPKIFYKAYIARKVQFQKTSYKQFVNDLNNYDVEQEYITKGIKQFFKMHE